jgi:hypothetical protein
MKRMLPRIVLFTEPITFSGAVANLGQQTASAFATQHALAIPASSTFQSSSKFAGDHCRIPVRSE